MLNSAEHEIFSTDKYENANNSHHFHIYKQWNFHVQLCLARKNLQFLVIWDYIIRTNFMLNCFIAMELGLSDSAVE